MSTLSEDAPLSVTDRVSTDDRIDPSVGVAPEPRREMPFLSDALCFKPTTGEPEALPESLLGLRRLLVRADSFTLAFVVCNALHEQSPLMDRVEAALPPERIVRRIGNFSSAADAIQALFEPGRDQPGDVVFVSALETLLPTHEPHPPLLQLLNQLRERFQSVHSSIVFWVSDSALTRIAREAPDFWAWRSGVFLVAFDREIVEQLVWSTLETVATSGLSDLLKTEKASYYEVLRGLWAELAKQEPPDEPQQAVVAFRLGSIASDLCHFAEARDWLKRSLAMTEAIGDQRGLSASLHQLAAIEGSQGNRGEALRLVERSLTIEEAIGDQRGLAASLHLLAQIGASLGNPSESRRLLQRSLAIFETIGDRQGLGASLHQLARIEASQGNPGEARHLLQRSLDIKQAIGDQHGLGSSLHQLGRIEASQGNPSEARRLLQRSLDIQEAIGDQRGLAASLHWLAGLEMQAGNRADARRLWERSIEITEGIGDVAGAAATKSNLAQLEALEGRNDLALKLAREAVRDLEAIGYAQVQGARGVLRDIEQFAAREGAARACDYKNG